MYKVYPKWTSLLLFIM